MEQDNIPVAKPVEEPKPPATVATAGGRATAALILGILSIVCMGFLTGIPAIIIGSMELKAIRKGESPKAGEGIARVGWILGIVGTILTCLAMLIFAALLAFGISLSGMGAAQSTSV